MFDSLDSAHSFAYDQLSSDARSLEICHTDPIWFELKRLERSVSERNYSESQRLIQKIQRDVQFHFGVTWRD